MKGLGFLAICLVVLTCVFLLEITLRFSSTTYLTKGQEEQRLSNLLKPTKLIKCDRLKDYDICYLNYSTILDPKRATLSILNPPYLTTSKQVEKIRPYPWHLVPKITELTLDTSPKNTTCGITHTAPAIVFSAGGYSGNFFHDFNDGFVPLFITINSLYPNQDIILVIINCRDNWLVKYGDLLRRFTNHSIINFDREKITHCFPSVTVGLISHGPMIINPSLLPGTEPKKTLMDFHALLKTTYSKGKPFLAEAKPRPLLVFMNRQGNRKILNIEEIRKAAEDVGFNVVLFEPNHKTTLFETYKVFESSHVMVGVHGAGLTHELFLRPGSSFIQIVPIGLNWLADVCFGKLAGRLGLEYDEYDISVHESTLLEKYGEDSIELNNPAAIIKGDWTTIKDKYLNQDVKLDVVRFTGVLNKTYEIAKKFMFRESLIMD